MSAVRIDHTIRLIHREAQTTRSLIQLRTIIEKLGR